MQPPTDLPGPDMDEPDVLRAVPERIWDFRVLDHGHEVARIDTAVVRSRADLTVRGAPYLAAKSGLFVGTFTLVDARGREVARATQPKSLFRRFEFSHGGAAYVLRAERALGRTFVLEDATGERGRVAPEHWWSNKLRAHLPRAFPLELRVFLLWIVILSWKRRAADDAPLPV